MATIRVELEPEEIVELKRRAEEEGMYSVSFLIKKIIREYLRR